LLIFVHEDLAKEEQAFQKLWESHKANWLAAQREPSLPPATPTPRVAIPEYSLVRNYLDQVHANSDSDDDETDEYQAYLTQKTLKQKPTNLFNWKINKVEEWPCLASLVFTILSIPAMSAEVERVFSSTKMLVTEWRSSLRVETIEANECLRSWIMQGLFGDKPQGL
jgi:hAT family C-terminal dimerisation region